MLPKSTFVLGGAASGKSIWAENLLLTSGLDPVYVATSRVFDSEIKLRVERHRSRRRERWRNFEADSDLQPVLAGLSDRQAVLIDCATMWLTNQLMDESDLPQAQANLLAAVQKCAAPTVIVSNEVGHGIVPENALARRFRDLQGALNVALAAQADLAVLVTAGLPQVLKGRLP